MADERCEVAARARDRADAASDALRAAQRSYETHESAAAAAMEIADPRVVQAFMGLRGERWSIAAHAQRLAS